MRRSNGTVPAGEIHGGAILVAPPTNALGMRGIERNGHLHQVSDSSPERARKQDVVFEMHMLVQIAFEGLQFLQAHSIRRARTRW
jgi:hypothetical protein